jgi:propanol-preferring alcohol dehydrogenase
MLAAVLERFGEPLVLRERPRPAVQAPGHVLDVLACGVCHSDLHIQAGRAGVELPLVPGHEVVVDDPELGPSLVYASWGCGRCRRCRAGEEQLCPRAADPGWQDDGGYAGSIALRSRRHLVPVDGLDPVRAAPLADAGLTPYRAVRRAATALEDGGTAVVGGAGGLGQFALQYLRRLTRADRIVAVDPSESKRARALALGADEAVEPGEELGPIRVGLDFVGTSESLGELVSAAEAGGLVVLVGEAGGSIEFGFGSARFEVGVTTSVLGSIPELREVVALARAGAMEWTVDPMPLARANEALDRLRSGAVEGRLVLVPPRPDGSGMSSAAPRAMS